MVEFHRPGNRIEIMNKPQHRDKNKLVYGGGLFAACYIAAGLTEANFQDPKPEQKREETSHESLRERLLRRGKRRYKR